MGILKKLYWILLVALVFPSCTPDKPEDNYGSYTGIKGRVNVQNEFQQPLYSERNAIDVLCHVGFQDLAVTADNTGQWLIPGAPLGTYTITYSKAGYSTVVVRDIKISNTIPKYAIEEGFQKVPTATITKLPLTDFSNFSMDLSYIAQGSDTSYSLEVSAVMVPAPPPTGQAKGYRIFIGSDETVSPLNYIFQEYKSTTVANINLTYNDTWFDAQGITSGQTLYAVIYGDVSFNQEIEKSDGTLIFPNLSQTPSDLASVVLP